MTRQPDHRMPVAIAPNPAAPANRAWATPARRRRDVALLVDPRFPGGTAAAAAAEIRALAPHVDLAVHALDTAMFRDRPVNPALALALRDTGLGLIRDQPVIRAEIIVLHNPSCLRFDHALKPRLSSAHTFVVTHENFLRPNGAEGFDVATCLDLVDRALICGQRWLAPISPGNRATVAAWSAAHRAPRTGARPVARWGIAGADWFNIIDLPRLDPNPAPRDRRGRHSRPGFEKFPGLDALNAQFPRHAEHCALLGADGLLLDPDPLPPHWHLLPFGSVDVTDFLAGIDFFVYFTHPLWRESFGRVIAEAIAAGKLVITDPATAAASALEGAVVVSEGGDIDGLIAGYIAEPARYGAFVRAAQAHLARFRPEEFTRRFLSLVETSAEQVDAVL